MRRLTKYVLIGLSLSLVLGMILLFPAILLKVMVEPIAAVLWAAWRVVASVDQSVYWSALIAGYLILTIRFLPRGAPDPTSPGYRHRHEPRTLVERWDVMLQGAHAGEEESAILRGNLMNLLAGAVSPERPMSPAELQQALAARRISLSPAAREYLFSPGTRIRQPITGNENSVGAWTARWVRRWTHRTGGADHTTIEELLQRMESIMEMTHDTRETNESER